MATLLDVVKKVLRACKKNTSITAFSDNDDSQYIVDRINEALQDIYSLRGTEIQADSSFTVTPSTRTYNVIAGLDLDRIFDWSVRINDPDGDIPLQVVTKQYIVDRYPLYETFEWDQPQYVYIDNNKLAVYPLLKAGSANLTIQFSYPAQPTEKTTTTATFPWPDMSYELTYIKKYAQYKYELSKGIGQPLDTAQDMEAAWAILTAKFTKQQRPRFIGYRRYGRS